MITLGIESTAHTLGISILRDNKVLCNLRDMYITEKGGIHPTEAALHHKAVKYSLLNQALEKTKLNIKDINLIAFSNAPGLAPCLLEGMNMAKELNEKYKIPLVPVNHCIAHLEITKLVTSAKDPVLLYVSGANTQIIAYEGKKYRIFGETLDIGVGNFLDKFARDLGYGFPGGPKIYELSLKSNNFIEIPYVVKGMDISLSGIYTNLKGKIGKYMKEDLAYSCQETVFAMLIETAERALAHIDKKELVLGGGVACNIRLQEMAKIMCRERGAKFFVPENQYLVDNAAMIAYLGSKMYKKKKKYNIDINPSQRTDDVEVFW